MNVLLVVVDTLRADRMSLYGNQRPTSPHMDGLAEHALVCDRAYSHAPWTMPSIASLFTSTYESVHGLSLNPGGGGDFPVLGDHFVTMAEYFRANGYRSAAFTSQPWISQRTGFDQGFDEFHVVGRTSQTFEAEKVALGGIEWMREKRNAPFFLYLHFMTPHTPYEPPPPFDSSPWSLPPPAKFEPHLGRGNLPIWIFLKHELAGDGPERATREDIDYLLAAYDAEVSYVDWWIGVLHRELRRQELLDDTLVVLVADHGESFFEHGRFLHDLHLYNEVLRIPMIFSNPRLFEQQQRLDNPVGIADLFPTVVDLLNLTPLDQFQGQSILAERSDAVLYSERRGLDRNDEHAALEKVQTAEWSMIHDHRTGEYELYHLETDPTEQVNRVATEPEAAARARQWLTNIRARNEAHPQLRETQTTGMDAETIERLRSLGYLE